MNIDVLKEASLMSYTADLIAGRTARIIRQNHTRDPFDIASALGIHIMFSDELSRLKGMYFVVKRSRFICVNSRLDEQTQRIVCAHELGHDQLHRELAAGGAMQEFVLYDMASRSEYEANVFAADLLLDEERMLDYMIHYRYDAEQIAQVMDTDINLVALRAAGLSHRGYKLNKLESRTDFLK